MVLNSVDTTGNILALRVSTLLPPLLSMQRSSWEQGSAAQALLECHRFQPSVLPNVLNYIYGLVHDSIVRQGPDGRLAVLLNGDGSSDSGAVDPACIGESLYYLLHMNAKYPGLLSEQDCVLLDDRVTWMLTFIIDKCPRAQVPESSTSSKDALFSHKIDALQIWSDTVYMLSPFLASSSVFHAHPNRSSTRFGPQDLLEMSLRQIILASTILQSSSGEWSHIFDLDKGVFQRKAYWGVGNGWACGGIARVLKTLAEAIEADDSIADVLLNHANLGLIQDCYNILRKTLDANLHHIRSDGLFHDVLDDKESFVETNLSQQLSYTLFRLLDLHSYSSSRVLERLHLPLLKPMTVIEWEGKASLMREAAMCKTDDWGFVRGVCGSPRFDKAGTAAEGQAWAILMEVARAEYMAHKEVHHVTIA
ncbi:hypothetical protein EW026_g3358 [Hermanssonia centrifuga]|uniref:Uncharacterized protein n=1 Tax=Hermanssonia centrifuga TaxID=98765 RepID=A0A4S4KKZ4_9APHY|nr:hypothetical protein EW026_g3358 [Hermanssonia centrifuga]